MNLNKTTSYALKVLVYMSENTNKQFSATTLNKNLKIPHHYLRTILTNLTKYDFIISFQGRSGGFKLAKQSNEIFISDIITALEGFNILNTCIVGFEKCPFDDKCPLHEQWQTTRNNVLKILRSTSLADLIKKH
jgi:Rrf2 family protein